MPGLVDNAGNLPLSLGIAQDKAIFPAVLGQPLIGLLAHQIAGKAQLVLAGPGKGHCLQSLVVGLLVGHAGVLVLLGPGFQNGHLLLGGPVGAVKGAGDAGCPAVRQHLLQRLQGHPLDAVVILHHNHIRLIVFGNRIVLVYKNHMDALGGEIIYVPVQLQSSHGGAAVLPEIVAILPFLVPAGLHHTVLGQEVALVLYLRPAGPHQALVIIVMSSVLFLFPAGDHGAVLAEQPETVLHLLLAGAENAIVPQVVNPGVQRQPVRGHGAVCQEVIAVSVQLLPVRNHRAVFGEVIGLTVNRLPSGAEAAGGGLEIIRLAVNLGKAQTKHPVGSKIASADFQLLPAGTHLVLVVKMIDLVFQRQPAGDFLPMEIRVGIDAVFLYPAAAVHIVVIPQPSRGTQQPQAQDNQEYAQQVFRSLLHAEAFLVPFFSYFTMVWIQTQLKDMDYFRNSSAVRVISRSSRAADASSSALTET